MTSRFCGMLMALLATTSATTSATAGRFLSPSPGPLSASHQSVDTCEKCHEGRATPDGLCLGCHEPQKTRIATGQGFHASKRVVGHPCAACHTEHRGTSHDVMGWEAVGGTGRFDHTPTGFPLRDRHRSVDCAACHQRVSPFGVRLFLGETRRCSTCHAKDSPHAVDATPLDCERCHTEAAWSRPRTPPDFDHDTQTSFLLEGHHEEVACAKCHPDGRFASDKQASACEGCHTSPHAGHLFSAKARPCQACHDPTDDSLGKSSFDHAIRTRFVLDGKHATRACASCHPAGQTQPPERACGGCHAKDSPHGTRFARLGERCDACHTTTDFSRIVFSHATQTGFSLSGKHAQVPCRSCHRGQNASDWERFDAKTIGCQGCHQHAEVHQRQFRDGQCLDCHVSSGTREMADASRFHGAFPLDGEHAEVPCALCHDNDVWRGVSKECGPTCHADVLHKGSLGPLCSRCHTGGTWEAKRFVHDGFPLLGFHQRTDCARCHPNGAFKPAAIDCVGCHADDDAHKGQLGTRCERCHRETGENAFRHERTRFPLDGAHAHQACASCHDTPTFATTAKECGGCHGEPALHKGKLGTACARCHTTTAWRPLAPVHDVGNFSLRGAHEKVACARCHADQRPLAGTGERCVRCHRADDTHANSLGPRCGECHSQWSFATARFDHATTGCNLIGRHRTVDCVDCHKAGNYSGLSSSCFSCHREDALTDGNASGENHDDLDHMECGSCHGLRSWQHPFRKPAGADSVCL